MVKVSLGILATVKTDRYQCGFSLKKHRNSNADCPIAGVMAEENEPRVSGILP